LFDFEALVVAHGICEFEIADTSVQKGEDKYLGKTPTQGNVRKRKQIGAYV
jgi:hypothetical protein